ncbi:glycoside hydrolase family 3 N-terminal domain-containing protein [Saccharothrix longispora]|uniref:glycoside hydrolase family 3 N-terminal domain-containing protein n=1 Tax=Saccharothrix longispora TaxID=33920 RepID=UPI0028FD28EE|nr:glycoside hydrolase family 3 N-terminal domain-containing protein [Saccharothrix longispora]MDU0290800.1 glycoside hydrolase family 3 N-terminal domain-containing protein [Saccharothrix longispora]
MLRSRKRTAVGALAVLALLVTGAQASGVIEPGSADYGDARAPVDRRVDDLLRRMTLEEKVGQMTQIRLGKLRGNCEWNPGPLREDCMKAVLEDAKVGSILSGGGDAPNPNTPRAWAEMTNAIQKFALDHSRLKIPVIYGADGVHGHSNVLSATMFPHQVGLGATWNPDLLEEIGASTGRAMRATGVFWNFAPVSDLARDTRWGRYYETYSEDPVLAGSLAAANVRGQQGPADDTAKLTATAKHFAGYSEPFNGHDRAPAQLPIRYLQDTVLPAFQPQFDAGVGTVMINSGAVNGVPAHASKYLLTEQLRDRMGFRGVAITDWEDIRFLVDRYHVAADYREAIALAVNAGVDMAMEPSNAAEFTSGLLANVRSGAISGRRIDQAVRRILTLKFQLGLFEKPFVDEAKADAIVEGADRRLARQAATEGTVLLRNEGVLPLSTNARKVVVTGDAADSVPRQLGGWTVGWQGIPSGSPLPPAVTVLQGIRTAVPAADVVSAPTQADAVTQAAGADAVVVVLGEDPGAEGDADTESPELTAEQQALVTAVRATGAPVVVVLLTGRPQVLGAVADAPALVAGWLPGSEGGNAIADVLFGAVNPSGKLAVSWPKTVGDQPFSYDQPRGANAGPSSSYDPQFAFGHGLSYTTFTTSTPVLKATEVRRDDQVRLSVAVANTGDRDGTVVVPVYVHQPVSQVLTPYQRLVGFTRVTLKAHEQRTVEVSFPTKHLAVTAGDMHGDGRPEVARGAYEVLVGEGRAGFTVR